MAVASRYRQSKAVEMSTSPSPPARKRTRSQARDGQNSSDDDSGDHGTPPANQQQASAHSLYAVTNESGSASSSSPAEQRVSPRRRSNKALYAPASGLARWPHFVWERKQGKRTARDGFSPSLEASLYSEVQRIAQRIMHDRKRGTSRQATVAAASAPGIDSNREQDCEPAQLVTLPVSPSTSSASTPAPSSPMSSRSASSLEFSEDEAVPQRKQPQTSSQASDDNTQGSWLSETAEGGERNLLSDTLLDPIVLGVQARLDALLYSLAMEYSARQMRASSKKERKRPMGHEEVLGLLEQDLERGSLGMVELQRRKSVLNSTREKVKRALGSEAGGQGAIESAEAEHDATSLSASALPDSSAHDLLSQEALQSRESAAQRDALLLLEPLGLLRTVSKRKRKAKKKQEPSKERPTTEDETEPPRKAEKQQRREQAIRGGGGFLLRRPPISNTSQ